MDRGKRRCRLHSSAASGEQGGGFPAQPGDPLDVRSHVPPVQSLPKLRGPPETLPAQLLLEQGSGGQLLQVDVLCGAGVLQVLLVVLQEGAAAEERGPQPRPPPQHPASVLLAWQPCPQHRPFSLLSGLSTHKGTLPVPFPCPGPPHPPPELLTQVSHPLSPQPSTPTTLI